MAMASSPSKRKSDHGGAKSISSNKKPKGDAKQLSSTQEKRAQKHERMSHRRHGDSVVVSKEIWNKLRLKNNSPEQVRELMSELMDLIRGKVNEIALQHDASRVVQAAIQHGTAEERREIVKELCASNVSELCKVQYAHFVVLKIIKYCSRDDESVRHLVKSLKGRIPKLAVHAVGARVIELLFSALPSKSTSALKLELYGPHFALFAMEDISQKSCPSLSANLERIPEKKAVTLEFVLSILNKGIEKGLFGFVYFQELFAEYVDVASPNEIRAIASSVVDHSIHLLSTRAGTRVVAACASYGTAKDRKRIMKSLKGYTRSSLLHRDAYLAILRLVQVTDDTVSVQKNVLAEILSSEKKDDSDDSSPLLEIALSDTGSRLFLMLLVAKDETRKKYFDPYERKVLQPNPTIIEDGAEVPTCKKNPETRRKELIQHLRKGLIEMCSTHTEELLRSVPGARVVREVYAAFQPKEVVDATVEVCVSELARLNEAGNSDDRPILFEDRDGHLAIKNLFLCDAELQKEEKYTPTFSNEFYAHTKSKLVKIGQSNRGAFVLTALLKVESTRSEAKAELSSKKKELTKHARADVKATAGFKALLQELSGKGK